MPGRRRRTRTRLLPCVSRFRPRQMTWEAFVALTCEMRWLNSSLTDRTTSAYRLNTYRVQSTRFCAFWRIDTSAAVASRPSEHPQIGWRHRNGTGFRLAIRPSNFWSYPSGFIGTMRSIYLSTALLTTTATAFQLPDFAPFLSALPVSLQDYIPEVLTNETRHDLLRRQTTSSSTCPTSFNSCENLGAPSLCCAANAVCSADYAGNVACCPSGAACSGTIGGVITAGTVNSDGVLVGGASANGSSGLAAATSASTTAAYGSTSDNGLVVASSTASSTEATDSTSATGSDFIIAGTSTVALPAAGVRAAQVVGLSLWLDIDGLCMLTMMLATCCASDHTTVGVPACMTDGALLILYSVDIDAVYTDFQTAINRNTGHLSS